MTIRPISGEERLDLAFPLQAYAFDRTPTGQDPRERYRDRLPFVSGNYTLLAEEDGAAAAVATAIPMRQNVRGQVLPMAGVAAVASHPLHRRRGHARALLLRLLGDMRDQGHAVSVLYPFRPSFYARFGFTGLPQHRKATFSPADLGELVRADLPGEVRWRPVAEGFDDHRALALRMAERLHGFAVFPDYRAAALRTEHKWLVTAHTEGEVVGALTYRIDEHMGDLTGDTLLCTGPLGRDLILGFLGRHVDQVGRVVLGVLPSETPELWATDLSVVTTSTVRVTASVAPMARVLAMEALSGIAAGPAALTVEVPDDPFIAGTWHLDGTSGTLRVTRAAEPPAATLTPIALSALVYGTLDPTEIALRGLGTVSPDAAAALRTLFPPASPFVWAQF